MEPKKRNRIAILVVTILLLLLLFLLRGCREELPVKTDPDLLSILVELREELEWPGIDIETAAANLATPEAVVDFVKKDIIYLPYRGAFADPEAMLRTRAGNSVDRARLTQALLDELGYKTRFMQLNPHAGKPGQPFTGSLQREKPEALRKLADYLDYDLSSSGAELESLRSDFSEIAQLLEKESSDAFAELKNIAPEFLSAAPPKPQHTGETVWMWTEYLNPETEKWQKADSTFENKLSGVAVSEIAAPESEAHISLTGIRGDGTRINLMSWSGDMVGRNAEILFLPADRRPEELLNIREPNEIWAWAPVLPVGQKIHRGNPFTPEGAVLSNYDGTPASFFDEDGNLDFHAPEVKQLSVLNARCGDGQRVRVRLAATTVDTPRWHAGHFTLKDNGKPVRQLRMEKAASNARPVILVVDTSGSMTSDGREKMARGAVNQLIDQLPDHQRLGLITHGYEKVSVMQQLVPKSEGKAKEVFSRVIFWSAERMLSAVNTALEMADEPSTILYLTDGKDSESSRPGYAERLEETLAAIRKSPSRLIPVGIGEADPVLMEKFAGASGTRYLEIDNPENLPSLYAQLGSELSGAVELSYTIPETAEPDSTRVLSVELEGYDGEVEASYTVKEGTPFGFVRIELEVSGNPNIKSKRTLVDFTDGYDGWRMMTKASLWMSPPTYPKHIIESRLVDEWIEALHVGAILEGGDLDESLFNRSFSYRQAATLSRINTYQTAISSTGVMPAGPALWMEKQSLHLKGETVVRRSNLDWLSNFDWPNSENREQLARGFLSLASAEGAVWSGKSVNATLLKDTSALRAITTPEQPPALSGLPLHELPGQPADWILICNPDSPESGWKIDTATGAVYAYLAHGREIAKGASLEETAAEFREIRSLLQLYSTLGGSAVSAAGLPSGAVLSAICAYFDQVVRMYCYSTLMMQQVGDAIENGGETFDPAKAKSTAEQLCETSGDADTFARSLLRETAYGFARGTAENVVAGEFASRFTDRYGIKTGSAADSVVSAATSAGAGFTDPTPGTFEELKKAFSPEGTPSAVTAPSLQNAVKKAIFP